MTWPPPIPFPVPMNMRDPVTPGSAIPVEVAFTMRRTPRDEMTTGEAEAYARGRAEALAEARNGAATIYVESLPQDVLEALANERPGPIVSVPRPCVPNMPQDAIDEWHGYLRHAEEDDRCALWAYGFQYAAEMLGVVLPDPPPEKTRARPPEAGYGAAGMVGSGEADTAISGDPGHSGGVVG